MKKISPPNFGGEGGKVKLTRKGRKPRTTFYQEPEDTPTFQPSTQDWMEIERGYGHVLPAALRAEIADIAGDYLWFFQCDKNKSFATEAIAYLEKVVKAPFPPSALANAPRKPAHKAARDVLLEYYLFDEASPMDECDSASFVSTPDRVATAARALADDMMAHDMAPNKSKPVEWDKMVVRLMIALRSYGLPYTVNKRGTKKGASPVVSLLHEMQDRLPEGYRRHVGGDGEAADETLAAAASAAWTLYKSSREGKYALREQAKLEKAKCEGGDYKSLERHERLDKVMNYLRDRRHRSLLPLKNLPK